VISETLLSVYPDLRFAYRGHSLLITDRTGAIGHQLHGLYEHDTRLLSRSTLLVNGRPPRLDALSAVDAYSTLGYYVCPPAPDAAIPLDALGLPQGERDRQVVIRVARFVGRGLHEDLEVTNHGLDEATLEIAWDLDADFADLMEARGGQRQQEAPVAVSWQVTGAGDGTLRFDYQHPRLRRGVLVRCHPHNGPQATHPPPRRDGHRVSVALHLRPQERARYCLTIAPIVEGQVFEPLFGCDSFGASGAGAGTRPPGARAARPWTARATRLSTPNPVVQLAWDRAVSDLGALALGDGPTPPEWAVPAAGMPLYGTLFGRDALTLAGQSLLLSPHLAEGALRLLARHLGTHDDDFYDEQPGRVPQQVRAGPLALLGLTPWRHDYGDYAAPCAYLVLLGGYHLATGDHRRVREFLDPAKRVLDWLDERADLDGDGFLEYQTRSPKGQQHQGWKDSGDAVRYADGREVAPPVAACEIQGYWYAAKLLMAEVFLHVGEGARALEQLRAARALKRRFNARFWMPEERFFAFALDAEKRQVKSIVSNVGHCLATGIIERRYARDVVRRLMAPDMFSGWGIRTLSARHPAYNPLKYHLGSVWPVENATTAFGMKRYGFHRECNALAHGMFDAAALFEHYRLPETFGGHPRDRAHPHPGLYPDACAPQGWSASAMVGLIQAMLGLWSYGPGNVLIIDPVLPAWLPDLTVRDLRIGAGRVSIRFRRGRDGATDYRILEREGPLHVVRQPPPDDLHAGPLARLRALGGSLLPGQ
jgi:glycogen debranching enzyme